MAETTTADEIESPQDMESSMFDFELHYGLFTDSVRDVLDEVLGDIASSTHIHNWDKKLITSSMHSLAGVVRSYLNDTHLSMNTLLGFSSVEEVFTVHGINSLWPVMQEAAKIESYLFFSKVWKQFLEPLKIPGD